MKKITFIILLTTVFGFSQSLPFTFDESTDPKYYFQECFDCNFRLATDPDDASNAVGELTSLAFAEFGSAQTIELAEYVDLSDDNNNTITFRIKPLNGTGSGNHMIKFSGGSTPYGVEFRFTTTGTEWQTITADFGSGFSNYRNMIIFPDFQAFATDIYLIDDIAGAVNIPSRPIPTQSAPLPTIAANKVKSVYGDAYTNIEYLYNFAESFRPVDIESNGNEALEVDLGYYGQGFANTDVSNELFVHFDYWTTDATRFALRVNSEDTSKNPTEIVNDKEYILGTQGSEPIVQGAWTSVFIPLSHYENLGVNLNYVYQYNFVDSGGTGTVFIDNIYFTSENVLSVNDVALSNFTVSPNPSSGIWNIRSKNQVMASIQVYDVLGKAVMSLSPSTTSISIDNSSLKAGLYLARVTSLNGSTSTIKLVRK
jgi:hypothetical protein